jgi:hypothetical protein
VPALVGFRGGVGGACGHEGDLVWARPGHAGAGVVHGSDPDRPAQVADRVREAPAKPASWAHAHCWDLPPTSCIHYRADADVGLGHVRLPGRCDSRESQRHYLVRRRAMQSWGRAWGQGPGPGVVDSLLFRWTQRQNASGGPIASWSCQWALTAGSHMGSDVKPSVRASSAIVRSSRLHAVGDAATRVTHSSRSCSRTSTVSTTSTARQAYSAATRSAWAARRQAGEHHFCGRPRGFASKASPQRGHARVRVLGGRIRRGVRLMTTEPTFRQDGRRSPGGPLCPPAVE